MSNANQEENGESFIPASQRPDGTWRKARRVKEGYVPQEEVPLYEPKGKKIMSKSFSPAQSAAAAGLTTHKTIPGLYVEEKAAKQKKKKETKLDTMTSQVANLAVGGKRVAQLQHRVLPLPNLPVPVTEPAKKLKNLKKRLREVEALELKIKNGSIVKPEPEQLTKVGRKNELILQIYELEKAQSHAV